MKNIYLWFIFYGFSKGNWKWFPNSACILVFELFVIDHLLGLFRRWIQPLKRPPKALLFCKTISISMAFMCSRIKLNTSWSWCLVFTTTSSASLFSFSYIPFNLYISSSLAFAKVFSQNSLHTRFWNLVNLV